MKKIVLTIITAIILMAVPAHADMSYGSFLFGGANDKMGNPITDGTFSMILDLNGDGWNGNSYLSQSSGAANDLSWLWDSNDLLMSQGQITNGEAYPVFSVSSADIPASYDAGVDKYYLLWFDKPFNLATAGPGAGIDYGVESLGTVGTDPGDYTTFPVGGSATFQTLGTQVVPEPISAVLAMIGGGAMALRRRFNKANV